MTDTTANSRTFKVNRVSPALTSLPTTSAKAALERMTTKVVEACSTPDAKVIDALGFHPLIEAAHIAFADHYGLTLSPDDIWLTIAQGFAAIINADAESFRSHFVAHEGKQKITVQRDGFVLGSPENDWPSVFAEFSSKIAASIGETNHGLLVANFSTTGPAERAASEVVLMDAVQSYFSYRVETMCGIPTITLKGTVEDWYAVKEKVRGLTVFGPRLDWWVNGIYPILDQFIAAAEGHVDTYFWESIYKGKSESGGLQIDGWLLKLLPYTKDWDGNRVVNPVVANDHGINASQLPSSLSAVPFIWNYLGQSIDYLFIAGHTGVEQDADTLSVRPVIGWAVRPDAKAK
ncbi:MAG: DUF4419 domain-containing protein [Cyanobacteria bacterium REEB67]|nr:DUF4419 domain-containing protein [Cyanobacteria bacterium REEB67]